MWTAVGITLGLGIILIFCEWLLARRKKEGITHTDKQRMAGILRIATMLAVLVGGLKWLAD